VVVVAAEVAEVVGPLPEVEVPGQLNGLRMHIFLKLNKNSCGFIMNFFIFNLKKNAAIKILFQTHCR
jgi:hypothetical protein